jgi:hypothetical protein
MFDLDEMKKLWIAQDKRLEESILLNRELLSSANLKKARSALQRMALLLSLEAVAWFAIVGFLGSFIYHHIGTLRLSLSGLALDVYAIAMLAATVRQIVGIREIEYGRPIAALQKQMEMLRVLRIRITQWALLGGTIVWAPFVIVTGKAFLGVDVDNAPWLWANVAFALCLIPLALRLSKAFGERMGRFPWIRRVMNDLAGRNSKAAADFLGKLSQFDADLHP